VSQLFKVCYHLKRAYGAINRKLILLSHLHFTVNWNSEFSRWHARYRCYHLGCN